MASTGWLVVWATATRHTDARSTGSDTRVAKATQRVIATDEEAVDDVAAGATQWEQDTSRARNAKCLQPRWW